ncbi:MAG: polysaccharide biosynthesis C-terminal domain-containing protein, partial [Alphaproteobacteria bacterium]|nr:polysaccharide biosynthesis C-terminal domain-containing protein [Alphaproteobacteria bacterium]
MTSKPLPYSHKGDLTTGPVGGHLVRMTVPMIWGLLAVISVQLADTYFVSLLGDTDVLAGISFTFPVTMLISHLTFGINIALSSIVSRLIGAGKQEDVRRVVLHGIIMAFSVSAVIAFLTYIFLEPVFKVLGADAATFPAILAYMPLWLAASAILAVPVNINSAIRASGDTKIPALIMIMIALINFVLDPVLIFGWLGFPAMGVEGAALATLIAYVLGAALALWVIIARKNLMATDGLHLDKFKDSMRRLLV